MGKEITDKDTPPQAKLSEIRDLIRSEYKGYGRRLAVAGIMAGTVASIEVVVAFLIAALTAAVLRGTTSDMPLGLDYSPKLLSVVALSAVIVRGLIDILGVRFQARTVEQYEHEARFGLFADFLDAEWDLQAQQDPGTVLSTTGVYMNSARDGLRNVIDAISNTITFIVLLLGSILAGGFWVLLVMAGSALLALAFRSLVREAHNAGHASRLAHLDFARLFLEVFGLAREIKIFGATERVKERIDRVSREMAHTNLRSAVAGGLLGSLYGTAVYFVATLGLFTIVILDVNNPQPYMVIVLLLYRGLGSGRSLNSTYQTLTGRIPSITYLRSQRQEWVDTRLPDTGETLHPPIELIEFDEVSYRYPDGTLALQNASFSIPRGTAVGLVGPSGSGKSTVVQLLLRLRLPTSGSLAVDGTDIHQIDPRSWFGHVVLVPQDTQLFGMSVIDNVICFRPDITREAAVDALRQAQVLEEVERLPNGLDTVVGEGGRQLSGGQRQRVCIARALAGKPDVLVLDEPAALDLLSEEAIRATLERLRGKLTLVVIAHRLSTLRICDRVMVLEDGRIEATGDRDELEASSDFYATAVRLARLT